MDDKQTKRQPRTFKANSNRRARTMRTGRRGIHDLDEMYRGLSGFYVPTIGFTDDTTLYGEVADSGISVLVDRFKRYAPLAKIPSSNRQFFDLGCGIGRLVVGVALLVPEIHSYGVEIVPDRVRSAHTALSRIHSRSLIQRIQIRNGSFLDSTISYSSSCWIFLSNLCLKPDVHKILAERLERECSSGCVIICSRELPLVSNPPLFERLETNLTVPMTWSTSSTCIIYRKK